ncbi:MAG: ATP phosphoribosyltransferase [Clostridiales bacterium]|jgi:ATP phosphoribosyltransferase|nr:ATP phosphoribosyltransferase [Clostridiales bacterium]
MQNLKLAVTKGRLLEDSIRLFEKMGLDCDELKSPGRRLIHGISNYPLEIVMAKGPDVITYVEHGVCAMGIVGKDTIMEQQSSFYEVLDLGFGACRFALAVKKGYDFYGSYKTRRVATKYPNVTKGYFLSKGMDVSIIKIEGSVEIAPLLGLSDGIVDIVQTGNTLKANGLEVIDDICPVSARLVINTAAMKLYKTQIIDFIDKCKKTLDQK